MRMLTFDAMQPWSWALGISAPAYVCVPGFSEVFQISNESRKEKSIQKKRMETWTFFEAGKETILKGLKQEFLRYCYVSIFFQWSEVYDYHVLYIVDVLGTWYFVVIYIQNVAT